MPDYSMAPGRTPTDGGFAGFRLADADVDDGEGAYREEATRSARVAAVVMVAATLIGLITTLQGNDAGGAAQSLVSPRNLIMAVVFDVMIAFWIWNGRRGAIGLAAVRLVAGAFLYGGIAAYLGQMFVAGVTFLASAAIIALIMTDLRMAVVGLLAAVGLLPACVGVVSMVGQSTGYNPLGRLLMAHQLEQADFEGVVEGRRLDYEIDLPGGWAVLRKDVVRELRPGADRWLIEPARDAHAIVSVSKRRAGTSKGIRRSDRQLLRSWVEDARRKVSPSQRRLEILDEDRAKIGFLPATYVHQVHWSGEVDIESIYAFVLTPTAQVRIWAFATAGSFRKVEDDLRHIVASLAVTDEAKDADHDDRSQLPAPLD